MNNVIVVQEGYSERNLTRDDRGLDFCESAVLGFDVREKVSTSDQILKDVAATRLV
jgi:hypothetical protein